MNYPPCKSACPIDTEAREYIQLVAERRYDKALGAILRQNPLPRVCGRICTHPCETACKRGQVDEPIAIRGLKRFAADGPWARGRSGRANTEPQGAKVAVIGSGPAGLSAARCLALLGYRITIFEKLAVLGGMMAVGIPSYRLPREVLADEIRAIQALGVEMRTGVCLGRDVTMSGLRADGYEAVYLATGLHVSRGLRVEGEDLPGVLKGVDFLREVAQGKTVDLGRRVVVVGGGNVAVDVARTALRLGAREVSMVCLEKEEEMPAWPTEMDAAREEGVVLLNCYGPKRFSRKDGGLLGVEFKYCTCVFDESGAFCPAYDENEIQGMTADTVIVAIGQAADLSYAKEGPLVVTRQGGLEADRATLATCKPGIFAGGDVVSGPATVTDAIAMGKRAARSIHLYLTGEAVSGIPPAKGADIARLPKPIVEKTRTFSRSEPTVLPLDQRRQGFAEVEPVLSEKEAVREALRCLHCYLGARIDQEACIACLTCVRVCPLGIPRFTKTGEVSIDPFLCQACGMCVVECPVRAIDITLDSGDKLFKEMGAFLGGPDRPGQAVVGFMDLHGDFTADDLERLQEAYPGLWPARVFGLRRIDVSDVLKAFELGADGVILAMCPQALDPFPEARGKVKARVERVQALLQAIGADGNRVGLYEMPVEGIGDKTWWDGFFEGLRDAETGKREEDEA